MTSEVTDQQITRVLMRLVIPAIVIGVLSAVLLWAVDKFAEVLEHGI